MIRANCEVQLYIEFYRIFCLQLLVLYGNKRQTKIKIGCVTRDVCMFMSKQQGFSENCNNKNHVDCDDCMCTCHIPGTMDNLAKNVARLDRSTPGLGESL